MSYDVSVTAQVGTDVTLTIEPSPTIQVAVQAGAPGNVGPKGDKGDKGDTGDAATIEVGTVTTGAPGSSVTVANSGTSGAAVFDFAIPRGDKGEKGDTGPGVPAGGTTGQLYAKKSDADYDGEWVDKPNSGVWGLITGTLSDQTDLQTALNAKASSAMLAAHVGDTTNPHDVSLDQVLDPAADKTFTMANKTVVWNFTNPNGGMEFNFTGAATGHSLSIHQSGGNPGSDMHLLHIGASDADPTILHLEGGAATSKALRIDSSTDSDAQPGRLEINSSGKMAWGPGGAATDVTLERSGSGALSASGNLATAGNLSSSSLTVTGNSDGVQAAVRRSAGQTADIMQWQTEGNAKLAGVDKDGVISAAGFVGPLTGNVSGTASSVSGVVALANGGTGVAAADANAALNALLPTQTGNESKVLVTDGTNASWGQASGSFYIDVVWNGSETEKVVDVSAYVTDANTAIWQVCDNANYFERMYLAIRALTATEIWIMSDPPLPAGTYRLIGVK